MLCSETELGLGDDDGILVLPRAWPPGTPLAEAVPESCDTIFRSASPNRPDGLGTSASRELATLYRLPWSPPEAALPARRGSTPTPASTRSSA